MGGDLPPSRRSPHPGTLRFEAAERRGGPTRDFPGSVGAGRTLRVRQRGKRRLRHPTGEPPQNRLRAPPSIWDAVFAGASSAPNAGLGLPDVPASQSEKRGTPQGGVESLSTARCGSRPREGVTANRRREITGSKHPPPGGENRSGAGGPVAAPAPTPPSWHSPAGARPATSGTNFLMAAGRRSASPSRHPPAQGDAPFPPPARERKFPRDPDAQNPPSRGPRRVPLHQPRGKRSRKKPQKTRLRNGKPATVNSQA